MTSMPTPLPPAASPPGDSIAIVDAPKVVANTMAAAVEKKDNRKSCLRCDSECGECVAMCGVLAIIGAGIAVVCIAPPI